MVLMTWCGSGYGGDGDGGGKGDHDKEREIESCSAVALAHAEQTPCHGLLKDWCCSFLTPFLLSHGISCWFPTSFPDWSMLKDRSYFGLTVCALLSTFPTFLTISVLLSFFIVGK